jgi:hypothetical protein
MTKTYNFPTQCNIKHFISKGGLPDIKLPFLSDMDDEFWDLHEEYKPKDNLTISLREDDDYGNDEILSHLIYNEEEGLTIWIIVYDVNVEIARVWVIGIYFETSNKQKEANLKLKEWAKNELL